MIIHRELIKCGYDVVYLFKRRESEQYTSFLVETTKQLINNALIKEIKYSYDNLKRVTRVQERYNETSSFEEVENYTYDKRGYLVGDNERTYEYDDNGNITKNGSDTLHYQTIEVDGVTKNTDILKSINYSAISSVSFVSYLSSLPLFPNSYKHLVLTYEGKNLIKVRHPSGEEFIYSYNHEGLRIKRSGNRSETVTYSYSGNKLIPQQSSSLKLEFLYDEKDYLYGFIKNNNERYYYIRDALGNILGIINQNGQIVVQYSYTSYGVCSISGNTSLGNENPFRYKGYYYDVETSLYYITTRYYDPEIGRFISPDSVDYLNPQSINGLNLYAYCGNDPVNYYDPRGCFLVLACILGLTALVGMGLAIGGVASDNNTLTAVGLGMVGTAALVSGGIALAGAIATGATLTGIIGGVTATAGLGSLGFMSAEIQEATGNGNWIMDTTGMSDGLYNTLLLSTAAIATLGTAASSVSSAFNIKSINGFGKYGDYYGMKFQTGAGKTRVLSFHNHGHKVAKGIKSIGEWHWQLQKWDPMGNKTSGTIDKWIWWSLTRM